MTATLLTTVGVAQSPAGLGTAQPLGTAETRTSTGPGSMGPAAEQTPSPSFDATQIAQVLGLPPPTPEQRDIIEAPLENTLVVAGAGSGKTETMAARVVWLVANGRLAPDEVLGLTFTRKAAGELAARIAARLRALAASGAALVPAATEGAAVVSTYHAYAGRIVAEHGLLLGVEPDARLLTEAAAWQLAHEVVTAYDGPMDKVAAAPATVTRAVVALAGEMAEHLRGLAEIGDYYERLQRRVEALPLGASKARGLPRQVRELLAVVAARRQVLPIVAAYAAAKTARGCLDFADQVAVAARLARDFPEVAAHERARYRVVLLDEFQDTSEAQLVLLRSLFADPAGGAQVPVVAVGDPHQSIYGWRGASATTLAQFPRLFAPEWDDAGPKEARIRHLSVSWRNDEGLLVAANRVAAPLVAASPVPVRRLQPAPVAARGAVEVARLETTALEAAYVAARIAREWYDGDGRPTGTSAAVLCRRRAQFVPIVEALRARGLPVEVVGLGGLLTMPEVQDVVALLSVAADPGRGDRLMRLLTGPAYRLGAADLDGLGAWARELHRRERNRSGSRSATIDEAGTGGDAGTGGESAPPAVAAANVTATAEVAAVPAAPAPTLIAPPEEQPSIVEAVERLPPPGWVGSEGETLSTPARERLGQLAVRIARLRGLTGAPLAEMCAEAERLLGLDVELLARPDVPVDAARTHLDALADAAAAFSAAADRPSLGGFLAWLEVALEEERGLEAPTAAVASGAVQVVTVHAAKGLEWDVVAVPGLVEGAFPSTGTGRSSYDEGTGEWTLPTARDKGWCVGLDRLPYDLRGDSAGLPVLRWQSAADLAELERELTATFEAGGERSVAEERRLAYVALTRGRHLAILTAPVWTDATTPRVTSRFLRELLADAGGVPLVRGPWAGMPEPEPGTGMPAHPGDGRPKSMPWPHDSLAGRRRGLADAADVWTEEVRALSTDPSAAVAALETEVAAGAASGDVGDLELLALLRERRRATAATTPRIDLPTHLSTSALVSLSADEESFASRLRRPMPAPPATRARAGSAFHAWVEERYQQAAIVDLDDLPGSGDEGDDVLDLTESKARFLASEWADRDPLEVELALETHLAGVAIRGRIDAVFRDGAGVIVVDWKTGRPPTGERARAAAIQLAVYRLAYARLRGLPLESVRAAFYYVTTGETVFPELAGEADLAAILTGSS